jgi:Tfp pilus assembly protein PilV
MCSSKTLQHGSTLTEALIALLIFSITTVTATAMLLESLRSLKDAINQQRAARLASNLQAIVTDLPADVLKNSSAPDSASQGNCNAAIRCTPADWLASEFRRLQDQAEKSLPAGRIELAEGLSGMAIRVSWASQNKAERLTYALQHEAV